MLPAPPALCPEKLLVSCIRLGLWFLGMYHGNILSCFLICLRVCVFVCKCHDLCMFISLWVYAFVLDSQFVWRCVHVFMNPYVGDIAQLVECLPTLYKTWIWSPVSYSSSVGVHTCNPSSMEVEVRGSDVQGYLGLCSEFKASLGCI